MGHLDGDNLPSRNQEGASAITQIKRLRKWWQDLNPEGCKNLVFDEPKRIEEIRTNDGRAVVVSRDLLDHRHLVKKWMQVVVPAPCLTSQLFSPEISA